MALTVRKGPVDWTFDYFKLVADAWPTNVPTGSTCLVYETVGSTGTLYTTPNDGTNWIVLNQAVVLDAADLAAIVAALLAGGLATAAALTAVSDLVTAIPVTAMRGTDSAMLAASGGAVGDTATAEDLSDIATTSLQAKVRRVLLWLSTIVGVLATAAHTGAVDAATTLMGYVKQIVTDLRALITTVGTPLTSADIQAAGLAALRDMYGGGDGNYHRQVTKSPASIATGDLFTYTGDIAFMIIGKVTTALEVKPFTLRLDVNADADGAEYLCAVSADCSGFALRTALGITGIVAEAMIGATGVSVIDTQATWKTAVSTTSGKIHLTASDTATGVIAWTILWLPITAGATLVAA